MAALALALAPALACGAPAAPATTARAAPELRVVDDDYAAALAEARATHEPLVAVSGAAWCDACREMRDVVLADRWLAEHGHEFTWLSIDVEREKNAAFVARFASEAQPVVWVIDPATETASLAWRGTLAPKALVAMVRAARADDALARALRADAAGDVEHAKTAYRAAIDRGGAEHAIAAAALVSLLATRGDAAGCAEIAAREAPKLAPEAAAPVVATGMECDATSPLGELARRLVADKGVAPGDASALFAALVAADRRRGDADTTTRDARAWVALLDAQSRDARSAAARASLDGARLAARIALGEPDAAVPDLARSERDLPRDYAAPARLARAFAATKRWDEARRAIDRAIARGYGAYRVALLAQKVDIEASGGEPHAALQTLDEALVLARSLPLTGGYARLRAALEVRRAEWGREKLAPNGR